MPLYLHTLGRLAITVDGATVTTIATQPVRAALLVYIGVERETTREAVCGLLWPDSDPGRARHTLSQTLYQLRADFGDDIIAVHGEMLRAGPAFDVDADLFERAVSADRPAEALELYGGDFLPDLRLASTNGFETWVDRQRARLARLHRRVRRGEITRLVEAGDIAVALRLSRSWTEIDPNEDEGWHRTIELLLREGDQAAAVRAYDQYTKQLAAHDLEPLEETTRLVEGLRSPGASISPPPPRVSTMPAISPGQRKLRQISGAAAVILVLAAGVLGLVSRGGEASGDPPRVLVTPLVNQTADPALDAIGELAADWIAQGLAWTGQLQVVPTMDVVPFGPAETPSTDTTAPIDAARAAAADILVSGRYYRTGDRLEFFAQITDVATGTVWHALEPVQTEDSDPVAAVDQLRERVMGALASRFTSEIPLEAPSVIHPPTYDAWVEYRLGAELFIRGEFQEAIPHLTRANELDPDFVRPLLLEASGWGNVGDRTRQDSVLRIVADRADQLAPYERAHLDWARADLAGDLAAAYDAGRRVVELAPGGTGNYVFARRMLNMGRPREALEIFARLDPEPEWMPDWWNAWSVITAAHHALGEYDRELEIARAASTGNPRLWNAVLEARALAALGRAGAVSDLIVEWSHAPADAGVDVGSMLWTAATELRAHGYEAAAGTVLERAVRWLRDVSQADPSAAHRWALVQALALSGRIAESTQTLAGLRAEDPQSLDYTGFEGVLAARFGDRSTAARVDTRLASLDRPYLRGRNTCWRAAIAASLGDASRALELLDAARSEGCLMGFALHANPDFEPIWQDPGFQALIATDR